MKYLNPKVDLTFKRIFGEHPCQEDRRTCLTARLMTRSGLSVASVRNDLSRIFAG